MNAIIERELQERREAVATYVALGKTDEVERLTLQLEVLASLR